MVSLLAVANSRSLRLSNTSWVKRFLYVNVFAELHGGHGDRRVHVIGGGHIGGVEILGLLVEELTPVGVAFALGEFTGKAILTCWIDLGTGHHLNVFHTGNGVYIEKAMPLAPKVTWRTVEFGESAQERVATYGKARAEVARNCGGTAKWISCCDCGGVAGVCNPFRLTLDCARMADQPNIIFVITDQQRYDTINVLGFPFVDTPHMDRLVRKGFVFQLPCGRAVLRQFAGEPVYRIFPAHNGHSGKCRCVAP